MREDKEIEEMSRKASAFAAKLRCRPFVIWPEDMQFLEKGRVPPSMKLPYLGEYVPHGWMKTLDMLIDVEDTTARPDMGESTIRKMLMSMKKDHGYAIVHASKDYVTVREYARDRRPRVE
jgi:hypothetical protein